MAPRQLTMEKKPEAVTPRDVTKLLADVPIADAKAPTQIRTGTAIKAL